MRTLPKRAIEWAKDKAKSFIGNLIPGGGSLGHKTEKQWAMAHLKDYGWGPNQFAPLDKLWTRESGWRWNADNPNSSAYGIPQALPGSKMSTAGADWRTNPVTQMRWGLHYIKTRPGYGSPSAAWAHSQATGWYRGGGIYDAPNLAKGAIVRARYGGTAVRVGEAGNDEAVVPLPRAWKRDAQRAPSASGDTTINIYGNLEFPNIKDGDDADRFVKHLKILAKG